MILYHQVLSPCFNFVSHLDEPFELILSIQLAGLASPVTNEALFWRLTGRNSGDAADQAEATKKEDAGSKYKDHLTAAERRYLQHLAELDNQRMVKMASKSHRDRIHEFNHYLANLTEHYAIPKVGPG
ncbi:Protein FAM32A [Linum grandiflorum]